MPDSSGKPIQGDLPHKGPDGKWYNWDGSPLSPEDSKSIISGAEGKGGGTGGAEGFTDTANVVKDQYPIDEAGSSLDTSLADDDRQRMATLLGQLTQQAATGGGSWEGTLKDSTAKAAASAQALGQSQPGVGYSSQLRNIGNAQGAVAQRAVGQGNILREQSKIDASDQLSALLNAQGGQDIEQANAGADARYGRRALEAERQAQLKKQHAQSDANNREIVDTTIKTTADIVGMGASEGGKVPGQPEVFGDNSVNDTVPAKLSPGEIVIPRSSAGSPEQAADFVRAIQSQGARGYDGGGEVKPEWSGYDPMKPGWDAFKGNNVAVGQQAALDERGPQEAPSIENGGLLDRTQVGQNRAAVLANQQMLDQRAMGQGPSVAPQQMQNATDAQLANALQAQARGRGTSSGDIVQGTAGAMQQDAGQSAATTAGEQQAGQGAAGRSLTALRGRDQAMAMAEQQAAWRNTQINAGIGLEQQALLNQISGANSQRVKNYVSGTGQAVGTLATLAGDDSGSYDLNDTNTPDFDAGGSDPSEWDTPDFWSGGKVKKYASGGAVDSRGVDFVNALRRVGIR